MVEVKGDGEDHSRLLPERNREFPQADMPIPGSLAQARGTAATMGACEWPQPNPLPAARHREWPEPDRPIQDRPLALRMTSTISFMISVSS
jgi:hypothetical protein